MIASKCATETAVNQLIKKICLVDKYSLLISRKFISRICLKDFAVNFVFKKFTCQVQNKEYLIVVFRHWPSSCKQFLSEYFAQNRMKVVKVIINIFYLKLQLLPATRHDSGEFIIQ